jgi:hypothetical protein
MQDVSLAAPVAAWLQSHGAVTAEALLPGKDGAVVLDDASTTALRNGQARTHSAAHAPHCR